MPVGILRSSLLGAVLLLAATQAKAIPVTYVFTSGSAIISVTDDLGLIGGPLTISLDGIAVTVDEATGTMVSMDLSTSGPWILAVNPARSGGFDTITINSALLSADDGTMTLIPGTDRAYDYTIGPVAVISDFTASVSSIPGSDVEFAGFPANSPSAGGTLFLEGMGVGATLTLDGITIAQVASPLSGTNVRVKADFFFEGVNPIPEAHAMALFALGAGIVGCATRKWWIRS
jgi:hypothetical protein